MQVELERFKARRELMQASGKAALRKEICEGGQSSVKHEIAWPWSPSGHAFEYGFTGHIEKFDVPMDGLYLIGAHGASGADVRHLFKKGHVNQGGRGAKLCCLSKLNKGQTLGIIVGGEGRAQYNGTTAEGDRMVSGGGGGASIVMILHKSDTRAPIIVAAGGGGATCTSTGTDASLETHGRDAPPTPWITGGSGGLGVMVAKEGHNAITGGSGRGGEGYFGGGGAGFYGPGGVDSFFNQPGPTPALAVTDRRLPRPPQSHRELMHAAAHSSKERLLTLAAAEASADAKGVATKTGRRRHHGGFGGGGAPCGKTMGGGGGGGFGGGGGGMHGGGGGGSFVGSGGGAAFLMKEVGWHGNGLVRIERLAGPEISKMTPEARHRLDHLIARCEPGSFRVVKSGSMEVIY